MTTDAARQTTGEEIANSVTHGIGAALAVIGLVVLVASAALRGTPRQIVACAIYGVSLTLLYSSSTLYHAITARRAKGIFRMLDHASIYLLIAGTYTPFTLVTLGGAWGWSLFAAVWILAVLGTIYQSLFLGRNPRVSTFLYVLMGWIIVVAVRPLLQVLPWQGFAWLVAGGLAYTLGVAFYGRRWRYAHTIWHLFVLTGSVCHFCAIYWYVLPQGA